MRRRTQKTRQKKPTRTHKTKKKKHTPPTSLHKIWWGAERHHTYARVSFCIVRDVSFSEETENSRAICILEEARDTILSDRNTGRRRAEKGALDAISHFLDFYGNAHDSRFAGSPNVRFRDVCTRARDDDARASIARTRRTMRAREKYARLFLAGVARFIQVARARARDFFRAYNTPRRNTFQETKKRGEKRRLSLRPKKSSTPTMRDWMMRARRTARAFTRTRTRTHPSTLPRSTIFTAQNVGDIAEKETHQYRRRRA